MKIRFDATPSAAQQSNGLAVRYAAAKREVPRWRWYLMVLLISLPVLYFAGPIAVSFWWRTSPGIILLQSVTIKAPAAGEVANVVKEGALVEAGAALAVIQPPRTASVVALGQQVPLNLPATAAGSQLDPGLGSQGAPAAADVQAALLQDAVDLAEQEVQARRQRLAALQELAREQASTRAEIDSARTALLQARSNLVRARLDQHARVRAMSVAAGLPSAASGSESGASRASTQATGGASPLPPSGEGPMVVATSPFKGKVAAVMAVPGEAVTSSSELMVVQGEQPPVIEAYVPPADGDLARKGRRATLSFFDGGRIDAEVVEVQTQTAKLPADRVGPLSPRSQTIVLRLQPLSPLPAKYLINQLPLNVRFGWVFPWASQKSGQRS